jgi:formylglycine-generating enzyme required for sulfatase activity
LGHLAVEKAKDYRSRDITVMCGKNSWFLMTRRSFLGSLWLLVSAAWIRPFSAFAADSNTGQHWRNSLGMKFSLIPDANVLFGVWDVRVKDYAVFAKETKQEWPKPSFVQTDEDPAVNVSWYDAMAFSDWLTKREHAAGTLSLDKMYRLPMDAEWTAGAGNGKYPWGDTWPPPPGAANYHKNLTHDKYWNTSPVGSFRANEYGLYDMAGNVYQWCMDWYKPSMNSDESRQKNPFLNADFGAKPGKVLRGSAWDRGWNWGTSFWKDDRFDFNTASRFFWEPTHRSDCFGIRLVVASSPKESEHNT